MQLMEKRFYRPFESYWEQFGYEIGGPVCVSYVCWLIEQVRERPEISDIAFVARDGWLLKQVYERMPHPEKIGIHYVYAPRTLTLLCQNTEILEEYRAYLDELSFGSGTVAVLDTVTMKFSSQHLLDLALPNNTYGLYWVVLRVREQYGKYYDYASFQKEKYHTIQNWNLMEFIMTSPEPSIRMLTDGRPVYRDADSSEKKREELFPDIETGVLGFVEDLIDAGNTPLISNVWITQWVNNFIKHPNEEDITAFQDLYVSELEDHSDHVPLSPFSRRGKVFTAKELKDRLWFYSQQHEGLYQFLHRGNLIFKYLSDRIQGRAYSTYDGKHTEQLAERLSSYDVVSFDIFDTLILRPLKKPTDLFGLMEQRNGLFDFHDNRIQAEADARRRSSSGEVNLFEIYDVLAPRYGQDGKEMALREIEEEKRVCYPNPAMTELFRWLADKGVRIIALSDMYLPAQFLREILDGCGFTSIADVFVSCEYGAGKTGGALQHIVQAKLGDKLRFIHIGDNLDSDVRGSIVAGWDAIRYLRKDRTL